MSNLAVTETVERIPAVQTESATIMSIIQQVAMTPGADIDKMERLMAMHERYQAQQAKQQYDEALARMQEELPVIEERGEIRDKFKNVQSTYALWEDINEKIKPILARHGFGLSFRIPSTKGGVEVEGVLSHRAGHREVTSIHLPADISGNKNAVQAVASSVSYGKRYTAGALLNFTTTGEDDDGQGAGQKPAPPEEPVITRAQAAQLEAKLQKCSQVLQDNFAAKYGCAANIYKSEFDSVSARITKAASRPQE
ncbi:Phage related protein [Pseudomonas chlororaphis subsp. aureofaciens]|uniref:ERF family protein n=1 Tax=Pseudomonas chlororaphis TaxID=587753 RepID=UPI000F56D1CA|nr:ERF family protein [Pseudomonas chlororaphis]AZD86557.1 Phage related protein [Pseudomonas chlororaphis subsp. aureofaciens]